MSPKSRARRCSNSSRPSKGKGKGKWSRPNSGWLPGTSRGGYLYSSPRSQAKETVRKGALFRRVRGNFDHFKIDPRGFDRTDDDDDEDPNRDAFHLELLAQRALHTYNAYYNEKYKFVSLEKAVRKQGEAFSYYLTFTMASKNGDVVKTVQAILHSVYKAAFVHYVKIIPSSSTVLPT